MRICFVLLCLCLGGPLAAWGEDLASGDVSNITEYLEGKFQLPAPSLADAPPSSNDLAAADGRIFRNVQVWKREPDGLTLHHDEGLTKLEFSLLPEDWQKKYGYDPEAAAAYQRLLADAFKEAERNQQLLRDEIAADRAKQNPE